MEDAQTELRKFVAPELMLGKGARLLSARYARNFGASQVLIVTDQGIIAAGWLQELADGLAAAAIPFHVFADLTPDPKAEEVMAGAEVYARGRCDTIIVIGGGSAIDCAKGIAIVSANGGHILDYEGVDRIASPGPPLICIPTTAGSSADVSQFAVITDRGRQVKISIISKMVVPDVSLIDPLPLTTMSPALTACTGLDALAHAIEAFVSNAHSPVTDLLALKAIRLLSSSLLPAYANPADLELRARTMLGCLSAGLAFSNASLGLLHAMAHSLGGQLGIPHGESDGILLSQVVAFNFDAAPERYAAIGEALGLTMVGLNHSEQKALLLDSLERLRKTLKVDRPLSRIGVKPDDLAKLAAKAMDDPCLATNPRPATRRDIEWLYARALGVRAVPSSFGEQPAGGPASGLPHSHPEGHAALRDKIIGLGERSFRKSYYPKLQQQVEDLQRFRALLDQSSDAIFLLEVPGGRLIDVNESACRQLGYSREILLSLSLGDIAGSPALDLRQGLAELNGGLVVDAELRKSDGAKIPVEITIRRVTFGGSPYAVASARDITERKRTEKELAAYREHLEDLVRQRTAALSEANERLQLEARERQQAESSLRESEEKYRSLVERANDGILILQEDDFKYVNPELARMLGYTQQELLSLTVDKIVIPEIYELIKERHRRRMANEPVPPKYDITLIRKTGETIAVEVNVGIVHYEGRPASLVFVRDIRERRQLEEARAKMSRLETIGVLAGGIAHDFNNLLAGILGNVSLAKSLVAAGSKTAALLANAEKISLHARELTQRLLTFSEGGAPMKKQLKLPDFLPPAVESVLAGTPVRCRFRIAADLWPVAGDPEQLRQLVNILVTNALEAMPGGGEIDISAMNTELAADQVNHLKAGRYARLVIADQGRGIAPADLPRIFDLYFSTKEMGSVKGTGLGLSIAFSIVRRHEGHIEVQSAVNQGTTVIIHLPAGQELDPDGEHPTSGAEDRKAIWIPQPVAGSAV